MLGTSNGGWGFLCLNMLNLYFAALFPMLLCACQPKQTALEAPAVDSVAESVSVVEASVEPAPSILDSCIYTKADSARVVELLKMQPTGSDVLFYARQFKGLPYVASTLEVADPERLVVNLRQLDCTTLVETTLALTLTKRQYGSSFEQYCHNLMRLRYWDGQMNGYLSRLHYFTWWMHDNIGKGLVEEVSDDKHFTTPIRIANHYMSTHPDKYKFLKDNQQRVDSIAKLEKAYNRSDGYYLSEEKTGLRQQELSAIHDGDLIAIVTKKDGIDYSHLGFAVWGKDGYLHLLNASSIHHKVVEEPKTLRQYLREHPSSIGIRLLRLK